MNHFYKNFITNLSFDGGNGHRNLSQERIEATKKQAKKWFITLIVVGLVIGGLVSIGVVALLDQFGLTDKPDQPFIEQIQQ